MKKINSFRNIVLSQSNVTNTIRIAYFGSIMFMVFSLVLTWWSTSSNRQALNHMQEIELFVNDFSGKKNKLDKYVLLCLQTKDEAYLNKYIEIASEIYNSYKLLSIFESNSITADEKTYLRNAMLELDNMIESDMYAINLIYSLLDNSFDNAHEFQKEFPLSADAYLLSNSGKLLLAGEIILENEENDYEKRYSKFFNDFIYATNERLANLYNDSWAFDNITIFFMLIFTILTVIILYITLVLMNRYINKPILDYTKALENIDNSETFVRKLKPAGTKELVMLADIINNSNKRMHTLLKVYSYGSLLADNFEDTIKRILSLVKTEYKLDSLMMADIFNNRKFKIYTVNGYTNEYDEKISNAYAVQFLRKRMRNLNYVHIKADSYIEAPVYELLRDYGYLSFSAFQLKPIGKHKYVLIALSKKESPLNSEAIAMMMLIGQHMFIVFENLKLYASLKQQLSDRMQAQSDMKKAKEEAEKANTAKTHFLANISHEIRTPLTSILGYSDILSATITDEKQRGYIKTINNAGNLLLQLINDVLDMSKIEAGMMNVQYYSFSPRVIFCEVEQLLHTKILERGIDFILEIDENIPEYIMLNEIYLRQILINLVGNAVKFTAKGYIKLKAYAHFPVAAKKDVFDLTIEIIDTGIGIDPEFLKRIFEPFVQQSGKNTRKYEGSGLGLSISQNLVNVMDGILSVKSKLGEGSTFTVAFYNIFTSTSEGESLSLGEDDDVIFNNSIAAVDEWLSGYTVLKDILQKLGVNVIPMQSLYELPEDLAEIYPSIVIIDSDDESLISKYKTILSFTIFSNAYILFVKNAGTDIKTLDRLIIDDFISRPFIMADIRKTLKKYLYFTKADRQDLLSVSSNFDDANISLELKQIIINEYVPKIESFNGAIKLSGVMEFAERLVSDGTMYNSNHLLELGQRLTKSAKNYNMSDIRQDLNKIGEFIGFAKELPLQ